jgi:hypothetical protein
MQAFALRDFNRVNSGTERKFENKKDKDMKTIINLNRGLTLCAAALTIALSGFITSNVSAADIEKGGQTQMRFSEVKTQKDVKALKTGDHMAMICAKCKTVWVSRVKADAKGAQIQMANGQPTEIVGKHDCAGCGSTLEVVGVQRGAEAVLKHSCKSCGDASAFCCATKAGETTKGMEKK